MSDQLSVELYRRVGYHSIFHVFVMIGGIHYYVGLNIYRPLRSFEIIKIPIQCNKNEGSTNAISQNKCCSAVCSQHSK